MASDRKLVETGLVLCCVVLIVRLLLLLLPIVQSLRSLFRQWLLTRDIPTLSVFDLAVPLDRFLPQFANLFDGKLIVKTWLGPACVVAVRDPADVKVILTSPNMLKKAILYDLLKIVLGNGLLTMDVPHYRRHRKAMNPSLHFEILQDFVSIFSKNALSFSKRLDLMAESGNVFNLAPFVGALTNATVCDTMLTTDTECLQDRREEFFNNISLASHLVLFRALRPWLYSDVLFRLSSIWPQWKSTAASLNSFVADILNIRLSEKAKERERESKVSSPREAQPRKRLAILDQFLASEDSHLLSRSELEEELKMLVLAGSLTSMDFFGFFFVAMSVEQDVQARVQKEIDDVLGADEDRQVEFTDIPHLEYLGRVMNETLRYFPLIPLMGRKATGDVKLPSGHTIPKGANVIVANFLLFSDERTFPEPHKFDPDRFLPELSEGRHPFAFLPFSAGVRNCIGQRYALMFAKTVFATVLRRFTILPGPDSPQRIQDVQTAPGIISGVKGGARVRLQRRYPSGQSETGRG